MAQADEEPRYTIVEERLIPVPDGRDTWLVVWKSITDGTEIRRRISEEQYERSVAGPRDEKPLWRRTQVDPIGEPAD
jgi:hypothetical protein